MQLMSQDILGISLGHLWHIFRISSRHLWDIYGTSSRYLWDISKTSLGYLWDIFKIPLGYLWDILGISWGYFGDIQWSIGPLVHWSFGPLVHWLNVKCLKSKWLNFCWSVPPSSSGHFSFFTVFRSKALFFHILVLVDQGETEIRQCQIMSSPSPNFVTFVVQHHIL